MDRLVDQLVVHRGITVQRQADVGVDHAEKSGGVHAMTAFHVAVILCRLQEQVFERVGGVEPIKVDVRVLAASNRDLKQRVAEGKFREDLFYRLNVVLIELPPLRERREDIPLLVETFKKEFTEINDRRELAISPKAMALLQDYHWPGNVRQLRNVMEGMVVMSGGKEITPRELPPEIGRAQPARGAVALRGGMTRAAAGRELIKATLADLGGNRAQTARTLGIGRKTLYRKLEEYGIL